MLKSVIFVVLILYCLAPALSQDPLCSSKFAIAKNGKIYLQAQATGLSFPQGLVSGAKAGSLSEDDVGSVRGSLRLANKGNQPECNGKTRGMMWQNTTLQICVQINKDSDFPTYAWQNLRTDSGVSNGNANGYEIVDSWGLVWDAFPRTLSNWQTANSVCTSLGGRLPTISELFRNAESIGFDSTITDYTAGTATNIPYFWTSTIGASANQYAIVRLYDGHITSAAEASLSRYLCVWESSPIDGFGGRKCFGPPGEECQEVHFFYNLDTVARPALTYAQAVAECNAAGASLPGPEHLLPLFINPDIKLDNAASQWLWTSSMEAAGADGMQRQVPVLRYITRNPDWLPNSNNLAFVSATTPYKFFCIGKKSTITTNYKPSLTGTACQGGCFELTKSRSRVLTDSTPRAPTTLAVAKTTCKNAGGTLPDVSRLSDLFQNGLPNTDTGDFLWVNTPVLSNNDTWPSDSPQLDFGLLNSVAPNSGKFWTVDANNAHWLPPDLTSSYRCVWPETFSQSFTTCGSNQYGQWNGQSITCNTVNPGNDGGRGHEGGDPDNWDFMWDGGDRNYTTWDAAQTDCLNDGGRLPYPTELYRIREDNPHNEATTIGGRTASPLWTLVPGTTAGSRITVRLTDGATDQAAETSVTYYRCVWPTTPSGNTFVARKCYGPPTAPCFQNGPLLWDARDRASVPFIAANVECRDLGGRLPSFGELSRLVQAGSVGSGNMLWTTSPIENDYATPDTHTPGVALASWVGTGSQTYTWEGGVESTFVTSRPFRCIFSQEM